MAEVSGFRVQGSGFRVQGSGFRVQGLRCMVQGRTRAPPPSGSIESDVPIAFACLLSGPTIRVVPRYPSNHHSIRIESNRIDELDHFKFDIFNHLGYELHQPASKRGENHHKSVKDFCLNAMAIIWP